MSSFWIAFIFLYVYLAVVALWQSIWIPILTEVQGNRGCSILFLMLIGWTAINLGLAKLLLWLLGE